MKKGTIKNEYIKRTKRKNDQKKATKNNIKKKSGTHARIRKKKKKNTQRAARGTGKHKPCPWEQSTYPC